MFFSLSPLCSTPFSHPIIILRSIIFEYDESYLKKYFWKSAKQEDPLSNLKRCKLQLHHWTDRWQSLLNYIYVSPWHFVLLPLYSKRYQQNQFILHPLTLSLWKDKPQLSNPLQQTPNSRLALERSFLNVITGVGKVTFKKCFMSKTDLLL